MKATFFRFATLFLTGVMVAYAQQRTTKETKVIFVVNESTHQVSQMRLFLEIKENYTKEEILKKYPNSKFYIGLLEGNFKKESGQIIPGEGATVIMYTNKQYFPEEHFFPGDNLFPGDNFNLGKAKAKVVSSKKGELILRTQ
ncbi:MAG: hypothetical protein AB3N14_10885 [Flavobacteriaceae bacterium]